ncbi:MAG: hypothetical protein ACREXX_00075 [Gammaproteobacteria bacterium]
MEPPTKVYPAGIVKCRVARGDGMPAPEEHCQTPGRLWIALRSPSMLADPHARR